MELVIKELEALHEKLKRNLTSIQNGISEMREEIKILTKESTEIKEKIDQISNVILILKGRDR